MQHDVEFLEPTVPVYRFEATAGPTALIQAGIHGDEIAGVHALQEMLEQGVQLKRGRLLVVPVMNPGAYRARQRAAPGGLDMNRCFPGDATAPEVEKRLAHAFMQLVDREQPALVATLHESLKRYHPEVPASFGQTVVYGVKPMPEIIERVIERLNRQLDNPYEVWASHHYPVSTSSTEVIVDRFGCTGVCIETWKGFDESRRISMQRAAVDAFLGELDML